jgi:hypothetical protein
VGLTADQPQADQPQIIWLSQERNEKYLPISPNLAPFAPLRELLRFGCGVTALGFCGENSFTVNPAEPGN